MEVSEARLVANRANAKRCKGPTSELGKSISRRNSLKHGLTGNGVVVPEGDQAEVERRVDALHAELQPQSDTGSLLIRKIAGLSVRSERAAEQENAQIAERVRDAVHAFDEERGRRVDDLFLALPHDPRAAVRNLRRMPEGVDRMLESWRMLRSHLACKGHHRWGGEHMARAAYLVGATHKDVEDMRLGDLSNAIWGRFEGLTPGDGVGLDDEALREWARFALLEYVDAQVAELEAHRTTLDFDRIAQNRLEAPARATFDDSKEAALARRYEADSDRGFYKALKEFRQVEAEARARNEAEPGPSEGARPESGMDSFREATLPGKVERVLASPEAPKVGNRAARRANEAALRAKGRLRPPA